MKEAGVQLTFLPVDERFYVRFSEEAAARFPAGAFSTVGNYPVYALRLLGDGGDARTEFLIPGSDGGFQWVDMREVRLARR